MTRLLKILILTLVLFPGSLLAESGIITSRQSTVKLEVPAEENIFSFAIFGDRTSGKISGLDILRKAVKEANQLSPDLVMTMGDYIQGYGGVEQWLSQAQEYKDIIGELNMPWFPNAGNHEVYWRGATKPTKEHENTYEKFFGPLWYAFEHKNCWFIVLFSDEGNQETDSKNFSSAKSQLMSKEQTAFLVETLQKAKNASQVFVFIHHPRWLGQTNIFNYGDDWDRIHEILKSAGNVKACFASHLHKLHFDGKKDGIDYYSLACIGANIPDERVEPSKGYLHEITVITVNRSDYNIAAIPVGSILDPKTEYLTTTLKESASWVINSEERRTITYPIDIPGYSPEYSGTLRIGVHDGADNNGDRGVNYQLSKPDGRIIGDGLLKSESTEWIEYEIEPSDKLEFKLIDNDTSFEGKYPGNSGNIVIELKIRIR